MMTRTVGFQRLWHKIIHGEDTRYVVPDQRLGEAAGEPAVERPANCQLDVPKRSERRLEPKLDSRNVDKNRASIFFRLPPELREMIYKEVLGSNALSIARLNTNKFICVRIEDCSGKISCYCGICLTYPRTRNFSRRYFDEPEYMQPPYHSTSLLLLLLTCKKIYSEAVNTLYSCNEFRFNHVRTLPRLAASIPTTYLNQIRTLRLHWRIFSYSTIDQDWASFVLILSTMTGLRNVQLILCYSEPYNEAALEMLSSLLYVRQIKNFNVESRIMMHSFQMDSSRWFEKECSLVEKGVYRHSYKDYFDCKDEFSPHLKVYVPP